MGKPEIAGPRRARPAPVQEAVAATPEPSPSEAAPVAPPSVRPKQRRVSRVRWFVLGAVLGAIGALAARGEAKATLLDLRQWSASELRRLEHKSQSAMEAAPVFVASVRRPPAPPAEGDCSCVTNPVPGDPCAALLAPFLHPAHPQPVVGAAKLIPSVRVEDLPRVRPPTVARRAHWRRAPPRPAAPPAVADDDDDDDDDADAVAAPSRGRALQQTAQNDLGY
jgi:hypothetical protein